MKNERNEKNEVPLGLCPMLRSIALQPSSCQSARGLQHHAWQAKNA